MDFEDTLAQMCDCIFGSHGQRLGQCCFSGGKPRGPIVRDEVYRDGNIHEGDAHQPPYI